jgi:hypothetical protein
MIFRLRLRLGNSQKLPPSLFFPRSAKSFAWSWFSAHWVNWLALPAEIVDAASKSSSLKFRCFSWKSGLMPVATPDISTAFAVTVFSARLPRFSVGLSASRADPTFALLWANRDQANVPTGHSFALQDYLFLLFPQFVNQVLMFPKNGLLIHIFELVFLLGLKRL